MKNEKMFASLLILFFVTSLSFNLFAQEETKKEKTIKIKTITEKDVDCKEKSTDVIWVLKDNEFEWDTTYCTEGENYFDTQAFLRKRFPDMDSSIHKKIEIRMDPKNRKLKLLKGGAHDKLIDLKNTFIVDDDGKAITIHIDNLDSIIPDRKVYKSFIISDGMEKGMKVSHKDSVEYQYEIHSLVDDGIENAVRLEVIKKGGDHLGNRVYAFGDTDELAAEHSLKKLSLNIVINDELDAEDLSCLKNAGIKIGDEKLALKKVYLYTDEEGFFNLKFKLKSEGKAVIKIIAKDGKEIFADKVQYFPGTYDKQTKLTMKDMGAYYIYIEQKGKTAAYKMKLSE